jgi:hypothetical protein
MCHWKRSDIPERLVLEVYARPPKDRFPVDEVLMRETGAPPKVVWAAMYREDSRGYLDCGVNLRGGWLTEEGKERLSTLRELERDEAPE